MPPAFAANDINVTPEQTAQAVDDGGAQVIDVRQQYEWDAGRIAGTVHIEMERLVSSAESIERDRPVIFCCRVGSRSAMAARAFRGSGYDAYSMTGGLVRWAAEERPLEPEGATVAPH